MKTKAALIAILFSATSMAWANGGGLIIDSTDEVESNTPSHMEVTETNTQSSSDQSDSAILIDYTIITDYTFDTAA